MGLNRNWNSNTQTLNRRNRQGLHRVSSGAAVGGVAIVGILEQSTNSGKAIVGLASQLAIAGALYGRSSRRNKD